MSEDNPSLHVLENIEGKSWEVVDEMVSRHLGETARYNLALHFKIKKGGTPNWLPPFLVSNIEIVYLASSAAPVF
jgi:hypothetical protein